MTSNATRRAPRFGRVVTAAGALLALIAGLALGMAPASAVADEKNDQQEIISYKSEATDYSRMWTDELMLEAIKSEAQNTIDVETRSEKTQSSKEDGQAKVSFPLIITPMAEPTTPFTNVVVKGKVVPATVGRLFYIYPNGNPGTCSGSVVNSDDKNLVYTAAHCSYNKRANRGGDGWLTNVTFVPAFNTIVTGSVGAGNLNIAINRPFGTWTMDEQVVAPEWMNASDTQLPSVRAYDQAFMTMHPLNGKEIANVVGANAISKYDSPWQLLPKIWGYPVNEPYDTPAMADRPHSCTSVTFPSDNTVVPNGPETVCEMAQGASGGPWFRDMPDKNKGYIFAITSGRWPAVPPASQTMVGAPNNDDTEVLYNYLAQ